MTPHANTVFLIVLSNLLPLLGVAWEGWDIFTLMVFYWCETLVIGFWTVMTVLFFKGQDSADDTPVGIVGAGLFGGHAGIFMGVHLFLMNSLYGGAWDGHFSSPEAFFDTFIIGQNLWPMLAMVFVHRFAIFLEERREASLKPALAGLYMRIIVMQFVIIFGAWGVMMLGSSMFGLLVLVGGRTVMDIFWPRLIGYALEMMPQMARR